MNKIELSQKSFFGFLSLLTMIVISLSLLTFYFRQFFNIYTGIGIILIIAFINGFIFGDSIKQSIAELVVVIELVVIIYLFVSFAFNHWGNASQIPITLGNLYILFFVTAFFSGFGFIFVLLFGFFIYRFANFGITIKQRNQNTNSEENLNTI